MEGDRGRRGEERRWRGRERGALEGESGGGGGCNSTHGDGGGREGGERGMRKRGRERGNSDVEGVMEVVVGGRCRVREGTVEVEWMVGKVGIARCSGGGEGGVGERGWRWRWM